MSNKLLLNNVVSNEGGTGGLPKPGDELFDGKWILEDLLLEEAQTTDFLYVKGCRAVRVEWSNSSQTFGTSIFNYNDRKELSGNIYDGMKTGNQTFEVRIPSGTTYIRFSVWEGHMYLPERMSVKGVV